MNALIALCLLCLVVLAGPGQTDETPETILIRRTLDNDVSGRRRADVELVLAQYDGRFVAYQGGQSADPRAWTILHPDLEAFARHLGQDLRTHRHEIERTIAFIHVHGHRALATSLDSGRVVQRQTGAPQAIRTGRLWTLIKVEEDWRIASVVEDLGDSLVPAAAQGEGAQEVAQVLAREKRAWEEANAGSLKELFDEDFIGGDAYDTFKPASWKILFSGTEELAKWLERRLRHATYSLDRQLIHAQVSGPEALAITRERVSVAHDKGPATYQRERYVLWTLSRKSGSWKITAMLYDLGLAN
jgi:ketosteroid isomerase-like protein